MTPSGLGDSWPQVQAENDRQRRAALAELDRLGEQLDQAMARVDAAAAPLFDRFKRKRG